MPDVSKSFDPVERTADGFFPLGEKSFASLCVHDGLPGPIDAPLFLQFGEVFVETHGKSGGVGGAE